MNRTTKYRVTGLPTGRKGNMLIDRFTVTEDDLLDNIRIAEYYNSPPLLTPGTYTRLSEVDHFGYAQLWMSDTPDEVLDHMDCITRIEGLTDGKILINGLGLGLVLNAAIRSDKASYITVVEIDEDVIALVAPYYEQLAKERDVKLNIVHANAMSYVPDVHYDVVWHDIWQRAEESNAPSMGKLHANYMNWADWQGTWRGDEVIRWVMRSSGQ